MQFLQRILKFWKYWPWILLGGGALVWALHVFGLLP